jgi:hypothetical protein
MVLRKPRRRSATGGATVVVAGWLVACGAFAIALIQMFLTPASVGLPATAANARSGIEPPGVDQTDPRAMRARLEHLPVFKSLEARTREIARERGATLE